MARLGLNIVKIAEVSINSTELVEVLRVVVRKVESSQKKLFIVTPNPEFIVYAQAHSWFKRILNQADIAIPDGVGLVMAGKILGEPIKERISGTDLMEELCKIAAKKGWTTYLLGGQPGIAKKTLTILKKRYPGLRGWAESGPKLEIANSKSIGNWKLETTEKWIEKINQKKPTFLFVAFGMGKQEKFIWDNWDKLNVKLAMGVGGAFDFISGKIPRAPKWVRETGFEWFFRLLQQPWRIRRQLTLLKFIGLVFKKKLRGFTLNSE